MYIAVKPAWGERTHLSKAPENSMKQAKLSLVFYNTLDL